MPDPLLLFGALEADAGAHLRRALVAHRRWCRDAGYPWPDALAALLATISAHSGQERPELHDDAVPLDTAGVPLALNYADAGRLLDVSERTVRRLVASGELPHVEIGGNRRVLRDDLVEYLETHRTTAVGAQGGMES